MGLSYLRHAGSLLPLVAALGLQLITAGCASECNGKLCVEIHDSAYRLEPCSGDSTTNCTFATVYFSASREGEDLTDPSSLDVKMTVNDRDVGVEGAAQLETLESNVAVQLLLDRSFSITDAGHADAVRSSALNFIENLPESALVRVSVFASEPSVPLLIWGPDCTTPRGDFVDKAAAARTVEACYQPYTAVTSSSQTKLYDAVANIGPGIRGLQNVLLVFTDGEDSASTQFRSARAVRQHLDANAPGLKVYAVGLGEEPSEESLTTISEGRFYRAGDAAALQTAFDSVTRELRAIFVYKVLVAGYEFEAKGRLKVTHDGTTVERTFTLRQ